MNCLIASAPRSFLAFEPGKVNATPGTTRFVHCKCVELRIKHQEHCIEGFLTSFDSEIEIVTDAPQYDWELFCELVYKDGRWPRIVRNFPTDATTLVPTSEGEELPHYALLDARIIASMFTPVCRGNGLS